MDKNRAPFVAGDQARRLVDGQPTGDVLTIHSCWWWEREGEWLVSIENGTSTGEGNSSAKRYIGCDLEVTHVIIRPPEPNIWVPLAFFSHFKGGKTFFYGLDNSRSLDITDVETVGVMELPEYCMLGLGQILWLAPDGIWRANAYEPQEDKNKEKVTDLEVLDLDTKHARIRIV